MKYNADTSAHQNHVEVVLFPEPTTLPQTVEKRQSQRESLQWSAVYERTAAEISTWDLDGCESDIEDCYRYHQHYQCIPRGYN